MASSPEVDSEAVALSKKLRSALWYHIGKVVDEESLNLGVNATPQFIGSLMELVWAQLGIFQTPPLIQAHAKWLFEKRFSQWISDRLLGRTGNTAADLESFAKHAGRSTIKTDDVMLLTRRNEGLAQVLKEELKKLETSKLKGDK
ncbi:uncharacterized protein A1O9_09840 [Exophiala aquamarina CBS 119918]|uniref:Centromere protein S n=1 Tax=Exophiala aquamarina CBS 119918 TaxID=1182545 RepID=A0A072PEP4_9EURO|nr:uncharacterized protein A1O9_09840 [Exophiala aquamarina CBS 119918]KEF54045.1 hypothetical protein A1O9_09840 [Exophiala aquamarina CBS 119918]